MFLKLWSKASDPVVKVTTVVRLDEQILADLRRRVNGQAVVTSATTDLQAGFMLGINHVLNVLQEGYTISRS